ncbi:MAG: RND transporter, partial [Rubrivivax sp.]|nr:RND transporter [Rubrivivax sp.]
MKPSSRALVTLAAAALLSACATAPDPSPPPAGPALPTRWQAPLPHDGAAADLAQWWARFNDPVLLPLQEAAQQASPTLASALARVERARASRAAAGA